MMRKKVILAFSILIVLVLLIPLVQMMTFSATTEGKMVVDKPIEAPYLQPSEKKIRLVFFGYVGCTKVCTPILQQISELYRSKEFEPLHSSTQMVFVNLMPEIPSEQAQSFAKSFHHDFSGVYLTPQELMSIDRTLGVFFAKSLSEEGEIDHSDHFYLIVTDKEGDMILKNIYSTHPINRSVIVKDIQKILNDIE